MIVCSARTHARQTGGNTRYIRMVGDGLRDRGVELRFAGPARAQTWAWAGFEALRMQDLARSGGARIAWYPADTGPVRRTRGVTTVLTLHGVAALHEPSVRSPIAGRVWRERAAAAGRAADRIITVSQSSADDVATLVGPGAAERITVIPHGVDPAWFAPPSPAELEAADALTGGAPFAFFFGNLEPRKNLPLAVEALALVREQHPDLRLVVSGAPGWDSTEARAVIDAQAWAEHVGRRTDAEVRALLARCAVFVFPSRYEGFGLPVLEAMAAGAPVVTTTRGALSEVAGEAAFAVERLDPAVFADAVLRALAADRGQVAARSRAHAATFSWDESVARHQEVLDVA